jgi:hemolysin activation/secretion protein
MSELNDMGRTEDIALGLNLYASIGFAEKTFGSDRDATLLRASVQRGWEPGGSGRLFQLTAIASTRHENEGFKDSVTQFDARYYRRNLNNRLLTVSLSAVDTHELDADSQVLLGGDNGLRGYPIRYQAGQDRVLFSVEERFYTEWYPWRLFRFGYAAFFDAGRVSGRDPRASAPLGMLYDAGVGLRLTVPRSSRGQIVHVDLAFPINAPPTIDNVQLIVETKGTF